MRAYAQEFPTEVAGLVYLDAPDVDMTYAELDAVFPRIHLGALKEGDIRRLRCAEK